MIDWPTFIPILLAALGGFIVASAPWFIKSRQQKAAERQQASEQKIREAQAEQERQERETQAALAYRREDVNISQTEIELLQDSLRRSHARSDRQDRKIDVLEAENDMLRRSNQEHRDRSALYYSALVQNGIAIPELRRIGDITRPLEPPKAP